MVDAARFLRLGLVGFPIGASLSPVMHEAALRADGLTGEYVRLEAADEVALALRWGELLEGGRDGVNVTLPWKLEAAALCRAHGHLEGVAARLGAVNTIVVERAAGVRLVGHNTDVPGLVNALRERWPRLEGRGSALVLGAGGAAYAALMAAHELGFEAIRVWNRTADKAQAMVAAVGLGEVVEDARAAAHGATLVLQAGSHGMGLAGEELEAAARVATGVLSRSAPSAKVMDLVYRPRPTAWVAAAQALGREAEDGLAMLIHQAALAYALWTGRPAPVAIMRAAAEAELARRARA